MTVRSSFRSLRESIAPRWLTTGEGGLVGYALDLVKDAFVHRAYLGLLASFPEVAPPDANAATGRDRRVVPAISETPERYVERLISWTDDRRTQGSPFALLDRIAEYVGNIRMRTVDNYGNWVTRDVNGEFLTVRNANNWDWDSEQISDAAFRWSRFWVILYPSSLGWTTGQSWNDADTQVWGDGRKVTWGSDVPSEYVENIRALVSDWKPEHARCVNIIEAFDDSSFSPFTPEPDGLWHRASKNVGGVQVPARLDTARYWAGV